MSFSHSCIDWCLFCEEDNCLFFLLIFSWKAEFPQTQYISYVYSINIFQETIDLFSLSPVNTFFVAIMKSAFGLQRIPWAHHVSQPIWTGLRCKASHYYCWRESHQVCRSWLPRSLCSSTPRNFCLLLLSETLLEFKYSLFKQFRWETLQEYCASLPNPSPHPNLLQTADLERARRHPFFSGLQFIRALCSYISIASSAYRRF